MSNSVGSDFNDWLIEEKIKSDCETGAIRKVLSNQICKKMKNEKISKRVLAEKIKEQNLNLTLNESESIVECFFDPEEDWTIRDLIMITTALNLEIEIELKDKEN